MAAGQDYVRYLMGKGLSQVAATAAVARFIQESSLKPTIVGDKSIPGGSVGLGQWNRERKQGLMNFAGDQWSDPYRQLDYFIHEGQGPEAASYNALLAAKTPEDAAKAMMSYERPQGWTAENPAGGHGYSNTLKNYYALAGGQPLNGQAEQPLNGQAQHPLNGQAQQPFPITQAQMPLAPSEQGPVKPQFQGPVAPQFQGPTAPPVQGPTAPPVQGPETPFGSPTAVAGATPDETTPWGKLRKKLAHAATGFKMPAVSKNDTTLASLAMPGAARVDTPAVSPFDENQIANQRQQLAMAMQRLNSGKLFL